MMKCRFCREELPEGATVCPVCGTPVEPGNEERQEEDRAQNENDGANDRFRNPYQYGSPNQEPQGGYQYGSSNQGANPYQYGSPNPGQNPYQYGSPNPEQNQNGKGVPYSGTPYMVLSIFTILMCCMPLGIVAVIYASRINALLRAGDYTGARDSAKKAKLFSIIGIIGGIISLTFVLMFNLGPLRDELLSSAPIVSEREDSGKADEGMIPDKEDKDEDNDKEKASAPAPAAKSSELGETWDTYTVQINDKVLTFPCTFEEMEAAGLSLDTEDTPEDYVVNADEYVMVFFEDANDNYIMADLINMTDNARTVRECLVGGVSVMDYGISEGGITVIFPGGLKIGSTREEMLEKYGNTDDIYEGDSLCMYTWYTEDSYYSRCEMDLDSETGLINSMSIQNYGE